MKRRLWVFAMCSLVVAQAGCSAKPTGDLGGLNTTVPPGCPTASANDVWVDGRLACFTVGQPFIDVSKSATGTPTDTAYIIAENAVDNSFTNINNGKDRYFEYILCVKQVPANIAFLSLATDFAVANGLGNFGWALPKGIATATTRIGSNLNTGPASVVTPCDPAVHPVIVDFPTGKIDSVNPGALGSLKITNS